MKKKIILIIRILIIIIFAGSLGAYFYYFYTPLKDGLYLKYKTVVESDESLPETVHEIRFSKQENGDYQADIFSQGLFEGKKSFKVDKYFIARDGLPMAGPTAAVLWVEPFSMRIGAELIPGNVLQYEKWNGRPVAVIKDPVLKDCYGYYDRKTGLQVAYNNGCFSQKIITFLEESSLKGL